MTSQWSGGTGWRLLWRWTRPRLTRRRRTGRGGARGRKGWVRRVLEIGQGNNGRRRPPKNAKLTKWYILQKCEQQRKAEGAIAIFHRAAWTQMWELTCLIFVKIEIIWTYLMASSSFVFNHFISLLWVSWGEPQSSGDKGWMRLRKMSRKSVASRPTVPITLRPASWKIDWIFCFIFSKDLPLSLVTPNMSSR